MIESKNHTAFEALLHEAQHHYAEHLPFVCYKSPNHTSVVFIGQKDDTLHHFTPHTETQKGFVFAPFDTTHSSIILIPHTLIVSHLPLQEVDGNACFETSEENFEEKQAHIALVSKAIEAIHKGDFEKVVLSRRITIKSTINPFITFTNMVMCYPSAFCYLFYHPKVGMWLAATPETLFKSNAETFQTMALAGTQPFKEGDIHWHTKEKEEQQIVTDTIVKQLKPYTTELKITPPHTVQAGKVVHLCTEISGKIAPNKADELIKRLHPTPAVCGYPTDEARKFIAANEGYSREYYTGYCGWVSENERDLYVNLRCMQIKKEQSYLYVGGGITKDSIPEKEYEETQNKAETMKLVVSC